MSSGNPIAAIDIALEPDATMEQRAEAVNAELSTDFPKGFRLDATHKPHISIELGNYGTARKKLQTWELAH